MLFGIMRVLPLAGAQCGNGRGVAFRPVLGDRMTLDDVVHRLGDVGGMVAHALDVLGAEQEMNAKSDISKNKEVKPK